MQLTGKCLQKTQQAEESRTEELRSGWTRTSESFSEEATLVHSKLNPLRGHTWNKIDIPQIAHREIRTESMQTCVMLVFLGSEQNDAITWPSWSHLRPGAIDNDCHHGPWKLKSDGTSITSYVWRCEWMGTSVRAGSYMILASSELDSFPVYH